MTEFGEAIWTQCDDGPSTYLDAGRARGESGVSILRMNLATHSVLQGGAAAASDLPAIDRHLRLDCRVGEVQAEP